MQLLTLPAATEQWEMADSVAYFHNKIISEIFDENGDAVYSLRRDEMEQLVLVKMEKYCGEISETERTISIREAYDKAGEVSQVFIENAGVEIPLEKLCEKIPGRENELQILKSYCDKMAVLETEDEVSNYTEDFTKLVDASKIPVKSKELIGVGAKVGGSSRLLWTAGKK